MFAPTSRRSFLQAAAIVVERGGPLSHAAILARELGVPAVLNLPDATTVLAGRTVTVDGDAGVVIVHPDEPDEPDGSDEPADPAATTHSSGDPRHDEQDEQEGAIR